ncbi:MAG: tetratricopeptide repeat protein [Alphaproteobacteria bacterium]
MSVSLTLAEASERSGDLVSAATYYAQAIAEGKGGARPYVRRGEIMLEMGQPEAAAAVFDDALAAGHDHTQIHRGLGRALAWLGQGEAARKEYEIALERTPEDVQTLNGYGVVLDMLGRHADAQQRYREATALAPSNLSVRNNLALSYALSGNLPEGIAILESIVQSGVSNAQHRQNLALLYGLSGDQDAAERLARRDLEADQASKNLELYSNMRHLFSGQGDGTPKAASVVAAPSQPAAGGVPSDAPPAVTYVREPVVTEPPLAVDESNAEADAAAVPEGPSVAPEPAQPKASAEDAEIIPVLVEPAPPSDGGAQTIAVEVVPADPSEADAQMIAVEVVPAQPPGPADASIEGVEIPVDGVGTLRSSPEGNEPVREISIEVIDEQGAIEIPIDGASGAAADESDLPPGTIVRPVGSPSPAGGSSDAVNNVASASAISERVPPEAGDWSIEAGPFEKRSEAELLWREIQSRQVPAARDAEHTVQSSASGFRLRVGPIPVFNDARQLCAMIEGGAPGCAVRPY